MRSGVSLPTFREADLPVACLESAFWGADIDWKSVASRDTLRRSEIAITLRTTPSLWMSSSVSSGSANNPYQYTGRENDGGGLYFHRARYYSPGMGRFISEDPFGLGGGLNGYAYVGGNPIQLSDPYGLY